MQLMQLYIKKFTLDRFAYVSAFNISFTCAIQQRAALTYEEQLCIINLVLLFLENLSANSRHLQSLSGIQSTQN